MNIVQYMFVVRKLARDLNHQLNDKLEYNKLAAAISHFRAVSAEEIRCVESISAEQAQQLVRSDTELKYSIKLTQ